MKCHNKEIETREMLVMRVIEEVTFLKGGTFFFCSAMRLLECGRRHPEMTPRDVACATCGRPAVRTDVNALHLDRGGAGRREGLRFRDGAAWARPAFSCVL